MVVVVEDVMKKRRVGVVEGVKEPVEVVEGAEESVKVVEDVEELVKVVEDVEESVEVVEGMSEKVEEEEGVQEVKGSESEEESMDEDLYLHQLKALSGGKEISTIKWYEKKESQVDRQVGDCNEGRKGWGGLGHQLIARRPSAVHFQWPGGRRVKLRTFP